MFSVSNIFNLRVYSFRIVLVKYEASNCRYYMDGSVSSYIDLYIIVKHYKLIFTLQSVYLLPT